MKTKAVIYARYSSEKQTEQSIEGQLRVCYEYARQNDYEIVDTYIDRAKTGRNDNRESFQSMIRDSSAKKFSVILVYALDRFSRNRYDSAIHKATLKKNGVKLISATQPITNSPEGILLESLLEGLAEYYSVELSQKLARGRRESINKGQYIGGFVPFGYKIIDKKYVINEEEAKKVRLIFDLFASGLSYTELRQYLKDNNILNRKSSNFKQHNIEIILKNKAYIGVLKIGEFINENAIPPIIEKSKFNEVQNRIMFNYRKKTKSTEEFLLTGKAICGECGCNLVGDCGTGKLGRRYYYYSCKDHKNGSGCDLPSIAKDKLETFVLKVIRENVDEKFINEITIDLLKEVNTSDIKKSIDSLKKEINVINTKLSNLANAISEGIINDKIKEQNAELLDKKSVLEVKLIELERNSAINLTEDNIQTYLRKFIYANDTEIISALLNKVIVYKTHIVVILNIRGEDGLNKMLDFDTIKGVLNNTPVSHQNEES